VKRTAIKRKPKPSPSSALVALERRMASEWHYRANRAPACPICRRDRVTLRRAGYFKLAGHHVIERQELDRVARERGLDDEATIRLRWDRRNCLPLCAFCHERHHGWSAMITRGRVRFLLPDIDVFAREIDRGWWIDRHYPEENLDPAA
jgi:hypothetical protein